MGGWGDEGTGKKTAKDLSASIASMGMRCIECCASCAWGVCISEMFNSHYKQRRYSFLNFPLGFPVKTMTFI